jgi:hypothetical protein
MNANKMFFKSCALVIISISTFGVMATNLDARSQSKVSNAMAKKWSNADSNKDGYQAQQDQNVVNIGSRRGGNCSVNVGTVQKGEKAPKEIIVTTKEVINVCK